MADPDYYRIMLGSKNAYARKCYEEGIASRSARVANAYAWKYYEEGWFGGDWNIRQDLSASLPEYWRDFNKKFIPLYLAIKPDKSRITAGLACGMLHTICKEIKQGDVVLCPDGKEAYRAGAVCSDYYYAPDGPLPHRRKVEWFAMPILRADMSEALRRSMGSGGTVCQLHKRYWHEIRTLLQADADMITTGEIAEDLSVFALEKYLEEFLVRNWPATELGKKYDIYEDDEAGVIGQQFQTDTGPLDILAISKDKRELLVVELKKECASDKVVGQIQRYMGYIADEFAEPGQTVRGCIIALDDDLRLRRALSVTNSIDFYRYRVQFNLLQG